MEGLFELLFFVLIGGPILWFVMLAVFHNGWAEAGSVYEWFNNLEAAIRGRPYARVADRKRAAAAEARRRQKEHEMESGFAEVREWMERELGMSEGARALDLDLLKAMKQTPL